MQSNYLDATEEEKQNIINDYLSYKLPPELKERYQKRKQEAIDLQEQNYQSPSDFDSLREQNSFRNLQAGLQKAANQFGTNPLDGKVSSSYNIDNEMAQANKIDASAFDYKAKQYAQAMDQERQSDSDLLKIDDYNMGLDEKANQTNRQAQADSWAQEQQGRTRKDWDIKDAEEASNAQKSDPNSPVSKSYQTLAQKLTNSKQDFSRLSAAQLESVVPALSKAYEIDQQRLNRIEARNEKAEARAALVSQRQYDNQVKRSDKKEDEEKKRNEKYEKDSQEFNMRYDNINANLNELESMIKDKGTFEAFGPHNEILNSKLYQIAIDYAKIVDPSSVAREGEVAAAQKYMLPVQGLQTKNSTALALIQKYKDDLRTKMGNKNANVRGAQFSAGQSKVPAEKTQSTVNDDPFAAWERK